MSKSVPSRYRLRMKQRLAVVEFARENGIKPASRRFGLARRTVRKWVQRHYLGGELKLVPKYPDRRKRRLPDSAIALVRQARTELRWGAPRTRIGLARVHQIRVDPRTIQHISCDLGRPVTNTPRCRPRQLKLLEKDEPGDSIQVDVKVVKLAREKTFQHTALDDCTRMRLLRLYPRQNQWSSLDFLREVRAAFPLSIHKIQCDNGPEFPLAFCLAVEAAGIPHRCIKPRRPEQNGKVERSHHIDDEESWSRHQPASLQQALQPARGGISTTTTGSPWRWSAARLRRSSQPTSRDEAARRTPNVHRC